MNMQNVVYAPMHSYYIYTMQASIPIAELGMEINDELLLGSAEEATLEIRAEVVSPPQPAALAAAQQPCQFRHCSPAASAVCQDEADELLVLLCCPRPPLHPLLVTAWLPPHRSIYY
jgi:hypothetical protein